MKRLYLFIILFALQSISYAQKESSINLSLGADYNHLMRKYIHSKSDVNLVGGLSFIQHFDEKSAWEGAVLFNRKGMSDYWADYQANYLSLGINYHYKISKYFFLFSGVKYSFFLSKDCSNESGIKTYLSLSDTILSSYRPYQVRWDEFTELNDDFVSVNIGAGVMISDLKISLSYSFNFTKQVRNIPSFKLKLGYPIFKRKSSQKRFHFTIKPKKKVSKNTSPKPIKTIKKPEALVFILKSYQKQINVLKENNQKIKLLAITNRRNQDNKEILEAFDKEFNVMPVFFIYEYNLENLLSGNYKKIFINNELKEDSTIVFKHKEFLIGRLGYNIEESSEDRSTLNTDFSHYGFLIKDKDNQNLPKNFPAYTSGRFLMIKNTPNETIKKVNHNLKRYLSLQKLNKL